MSSLLRSVDDGLPNEDGIGHTSWAEDNSTMFARILDLYARPGMAVADVTYGKGVFWRNVQQRDYALLATDLAVDGVDATSLPYADESLDMVIFDPPYRYVETRSTAGHTDAQYRLTETLREVRPGLDGVLDLYRDGISEAVRVLRHGGFLVVKCQDTTADGRQRWVHMDVMSWCESAGAEVIDLAVVVTRKPPPTRWKVQRTFKKAHSYFVVARKGGRAPFGYRSVQRRDAS